MFNALLFQYGGGAVLHQTHLGGRIPLDAGDPETDVVDIPARVADGEDPLAAGGAVEVCAEQLIQQDAELLRGHAVGVLIGA